MADLVSPCQYERVPIDDSLYAIVIYVSLVVPFGLIYEIERLVSKERL